MSGRCGAQIDQREFSLMALPSLDDYFPDWKEREALAEAMIPIIGNLYRKNVVTYCFGRGLYSESVTNIMKTHRYVRQIANNELSEFESYPIMKALSELDLGPCHIDVGKLALQYMAASANNGITPMDFVKEACAEVIGRHVPPLERPQDVVLYGFGRIGRLLARLLIEKTGGGQQLRLRAIVVRKAGKEDLGKRASLLRRDSVHGSFKGTLRIDEENNCIIANGNVIRVIYASSPATVDYTQYGIIRRDRHRQHRCMARRERSVGTPEVEGRISRHRHRAGQRRDPQYRVRHQLEHADEGRSDHRRRVVYDERDRADPEGARRRIHDRARSHRDGARVYARPESARQLSREKPSRAQRTVEPRDYRDRRVVGNHRFAAEPRRQADGQRNSRTDAERVAGDSEL